MEEKNNVEETKEMVVSNNSNMMVHDMSELNNNQKSNVQIFTTITDEKTIFNLEQNCDYKINDCEGQTIRVVDMLCKIIEKPIEEPIVDEQTGEIKDKEITIITILIDDNGKSYVTKSKLFFYSWKKCYQIFEQKIKDGIDIKIIKTSVRGSGNKALGFELV